MYGYIDAGRYEQFCKAGQIFSAANQSAKTFTLFGNTTATGLLISNPTGSGKILSILALGFEKAAVASAQFEDLVISAGAMGASYAHTNALTPKNNSIGHAATPVGLVDDSATLTAAGVIMAPFLVPSISATAAVAIPPPALVMIDGLWTIQPGSFLQIAAGFTNTVSGIASVHWREIE